MEKNRLRLFREVQLFVDEAVRQADSVVEFREDDTVFLERP